MDRLIGLMSVILLVAVSFGCEGEIKENFDPDEEIPLEEFCETTDLTPGRVIVRRLSHREMDRSLAALFLLDPNARFSSSFPLDDETSSGFLNDASTLNMSPVLLEAYNTVATQLAESAATQQAFLERYLPCGDETCLSNFVVDFGLHAWRRPLSAAEETTMATLIQNANGTFSERLTIGIRAFIMSPKFLYRAEPHAPRGQVRDLDGYELASRLSFFLWGAPPDDTLYAQAENGNILSDAGLEEQFSRMVADERIHGFLQDFVSRWLHTATLNEHVVAENLFPEWNPRLSELLQEETELFFLEVVRNDMPLTQLLQADFTFLNEALANHYGIEGVSGDEMRRVELSNERRGGILTHGALLTLTSHSDLTSPVERGKFVLDRILCAAPPAAPAVFETPGQSESMSRRESLEAHRANPQCAVCHDMMDPIGFALENFDPIGRWRNTEDGTENGFPVDASGELPNGTLIDGPAELSAALAADERFAPCVSSKVLEYALGRTSRRQDQCFANEFIADGNTTMGQLLRGVVMSEVFRRVGTTDESTEAPAPGQESR